MLILLLVTCDDAPLFQTSSYLRLTKHGRRYVAPPKKKVKEKREENEKKNIQTQKTLHCAFLSCDGKAVQNPKSKSVSGRYHQDV